MRVPLFLIILIFSFNVIGQNSSKYILNSFADRYKNYIDDYVIQQQSQIFQPMPTIYGWVESEAVIGAKRITRSKNTSINGSQLISNTSDLNKQQKQMVDKKMGYSSLAVNSSNSKLNRQLTQNYYRQKNSTVLQQRQHIYSLLNEAHTEEARFRKNKLNNSISALPSPAETKPYIDALENIKKQLTGENKLSIADTYYEVENAYGDTYLSKAEYDKLLDESIQFIYQWIDQKGYDRNDNEAKNKAIQQFLSKELSIKLIFKNELDQQKIITHSPFTYDYEDFKGEKDHRNYFITKCLATGYGQCNSLPGVYMALAEKMDATAYLCIAPQHAYIKYPDKNGILHSYEPTSNWSITDQWYKEHMFVSQEGVNNGIYLDTLNTKQIVASSLLDLAFGYLQKHGTSDGKFINECINQAFNYFPKNNILPYLVKSTLLARQLDQVLNRNGITNLNNIDQVPKAVPIYNLLRENEVTVKELGYQRVPEQLYEQVMEEHEFKGRKQSASKISGKEKRDLFNVTIK